MAAIAAGCHGLVARRDALDAGLTRAELRTRLRNGLLVVEHPGVYSVGHPALTVEARYLAAVLACGPQARLVGTAAAHLLSLIFGDPPPPEVAAPVERRVEGVRTRRIRGRPLPPPITVRGVPISAPAEVLVDLAGTLGESVLARACHEAGVRYRVSPADVERVLGRRPNAKGAGMLRRICHGGVPVALSFMEATFAARLKAEDLPLPNMNRVASGKRVDCRWPGHRLTIELDGYRYHNSRYSWEQDRRRERDARARGDEFRRFSYLEVIEEPAAMIAELRSLLA